MSSIVCTEKIIQCKQQNTRSRKFLISLNMSSIICDGKIIRHK